MKLRLLLFLLSIPFLASASISIKIYSPGIRYYTDSVTSYTAVQSTLGKLYVVSNEFYTVIGTRVFKYDLSAAKLQAKVTSFSPVTAGTGDTVTINGGNFSQVTAVPDHRIRYR